MLNDIAFLCLKCLISEYCPREQRRACRAPCMMSGRVELQVVSFVQYSDESLHIAIHVEEHRKTCHA